MLLSPLASVRTVSDQANRSRSWGENDPAFLMTPCVCPAVPEGYLTNLAKLGPMLDGKWNTRSSSWYLTL